MNTASSASHIRASQSDGVRRIVGSLGGVYEVVRDLAPGGMADAFVVRRRGVGQSEFVYALKRMRFGAKHREFMSEATVISRLRHDRIVRAFDADRDHEGLCFIVMEFVEGVDLAQLLDFYAERDERLAPELAVHIIVQVLEALDYAHSFVDDEIGVQAIVHRDVTPSNILLDKHGYVKLADFGIAKWKSRETYTRTGAVRGKFPYMSPEHLRRDVKLDQRTDLFSAGATLFEMLSGRLAFEPDDSGERRRRISLDDLGLSISPALAELVDRLLAPRREDRPAAAREVLELLAPHDVDRRARHHLSEAVTACWQELRDMAQRDREEADVVDEADALLAQRIERATVAAAPVVTQRRTRGGRARIAWGAVLGVGLVVVMLLGWNQLVSSGVARHHEAQPRPAAPSPRSLAPEPVVTTAPLAAPEPEPVPAPEPPQSTAMTLSPASADTATRPQRRARGRRVVDGERGDVRIVVRAVNGHAELIDGDEVHRGRSPLVVRGLPPGLYQVRAAEAGDMQHAVTATVEVRAGRQTEHRIKLTNPFE